MATCFDRKQSSSGQKKNILFKVKKGNTEWDPIQFTVQYKRMYSDTSDNEDNSFRNRIR